MNKYLFLLILGCSIFSCQPQEDVAIDLGPLPEPPTFSMEALESNPNLIAISFTSSDFFDYVWDTQGGTPNRSVKAQDTIFYSSAGNYAITLHASKIGGSGTSSATQTITIDQDAEAMCEGVVSILTGECTSQCWKLSPDPGSVIVGPIPFSAEWFNSPGLDPAQENDLWCFDFEGGGHQYINNGETFSACQGFVAVTDYPIPTGVTYQVIPSGSSNSDQKIVIDEGSWIGIEDTGPEYEIVSITEDEMILLTPIKPCDGAPSPGWFTLTFEKE